MAKDVITVHGQEVVVREDTARAFRGVKWAKIVIIISLSLMAALALVAFLIASRDGSVESPAVSDSPNSK